MKINYTEEEYLNAKSEDFLSCICYKCGKPFNLKKKYITFGIKHNIKHSMFCSKTCRYSYFEINRIVVKCLNCNKEFEKKIL